MNQTLIYLYEINSLQHRLAMTEFSSLFPKRQSIMRF